MCIPDAYKPYIFISGSSFTFNNWAYASDLSAYLFLPPTTEWLLTCVTRQVLLLFMLLSQKTMLRSLSHDQEGVHHPQISEYVKIHTVTQTQSSQVNCGHCSSKPCQMCPLSSFHTQMTSLTVAITHINQYTSLWVLAPSPSFKSSIKVVISS